MCCKNGIMWWFEGRGKFVKEERVMGWWIGMWGGIG